VLAQYGVSLNLWQNILYEIARKLKYGWKNNLPDLKTFFTDESKNIHGIYCADWKWYINEDFWLDNDFATDSELDSIDKMTYFYEKMIDATKSSFTGQMIENLTNKELWEEFARIALNNIDLRKNQNWIKDKIKTYLMDNCTGDKYIKLPEDMFLEWTKAGIPWLAAYAYKLENGKLLSQSTIPWVESSWIV
jgi:hypothetical protein